MSNNKRRAQPATPNEARISEAAMKFIRSYVESGSIGKRGAIQAEAWRRLREAVNIPTKAKDEEKREHARKARAVARRREHPFTRTQLDQWFSSGFRRGLGADSEDE